MQDNDKDWKEARPAGTPSDVQTPCIWITALWCDGFAL
jgi:hypothetical protein